MQHHQRRTATGTAKMHTSPVHRHKASLHFDVQDELPDWRSYNARVDPTYGDNAGDVNQDVHAAIGNGDAEYGRGCLGYIAAV